MSLTSLMDRRWYPDHGDEWDARAFRARVRAALRPEFELLDIGAGRGATPHMDFRGLAKRIVGADVDEAVLQNPQLDAAFHTPDGDLGALPDASFDLIVCKDVLEHVSDPGTFFAEVSRLLRPGGQFLAKTPGGLHYVTVIARVTPLWFHKAFNKMRGRETFDTFPTLYRANTRRQLAAHAAGAGLELVSVDGEEGRPEYLRFTPAAYVAGAAYEKVVNRLNVPEIRAALYVEMRKPA